VHVDVPLKDAGGVTDKFCADHVFAPTRGCVSKSCTVDLHADQRLSCDVSLVQRGLHPVLVVVYRLYCPAGRREP